MEYTTNYQLPTWVESDRIQMDDFNDMTDKLDAAIAAVNQRIDQVNPVVKLKEVVLTSNQSRVDIDLSDVDWSKYIAAKLYINYTLTSPQTSLVTLKVQVNDKAGDSDYRAGSTSTYTDALISAQTATNGANIYATIAQAPDISAFYQIAIASSWNSCTQGERICMYNNGTLLYKLSVFPDSYALAANSRVAIYGIRK